VVAVRCPWCRQRDAVEHAVCGACLAELALTGYRFDKPPEELADRPPPVPGPFYRGRVSASALGKFVRCPEQYRREYLRGEWGPTVGKMVVGNTIHRALEHYWRYEVFEGSPPTDGVADDMLDTAFSEKADDDVEWGDMRRGEALDRSARVFANYRKRVARLVVPQLVEQWFELRVPGCPVDVVGKVDLVGHVPACDSPVHDLLAWVDELEAAAAAGPEGAIDAARDLPLRLMHAKLDVKSSFKGALKQVDPGWRIQGLVYLLVDALPMTWHTLSLTWRGKEGTPIIRSCASPDVEDGLVLHRTADAFASANELVRQLVAAIELYYDTFGPDDPWPSGAVAHTWACGLCHLRDDPEAPCVYWHGRQAPAWNLEGAAG
jgi:hypothetical protein